MEYKYSTINEVNHFEFGEAVVGDIQLTERMFHLVLDNVKICPENSCNRDLEIIKREPEHDKVKLYVKKTVGKAIQIKNLSDQLFEFFLINSGQQPQMEKSESIAFVMEDYCSELCNVLQTNGYTVTLGWKQWEEVKISVCYDYIGRIMNNLLSNLLKYADKTKEILLDMGICQDEFFFSIMNAAANKEQDHRGTGIGVHNIEIMMEQMQGRCEEECGEESYRICLYFPLEKSENS